MNLHGTYLQDVLNFRQYLCCSDHQDNWHGPRSVYLGYDQPSQWLGDQQVWQASLLFIPKTRYFLYFC